MRRLFGVGDYLLESVHSSRDRVVVAFSWADEQGQRQGWAHALRMSQGKIVDIQDFASARRAVALMRLRTAFG